MSGAGLSRWEGVAPAAGLDPDICDTFLSTRGFGRGVYKVDDAVYGTTLRINRQRRESLGGRKLMLVISQCAKVVGDPVVYGRIRAMAGCRARNALGRDAGGRCVVQFRREWPSGEVQSPGQCLESLLGYPGGGGRGWRYTRSGERGLREEAGVVREK